MEITALTTLPAALAALLLALAPEVAPRAPVEGAADAEVPQDDAADEAAEAGPDPEAEAVTTGEPPAGLLYSGDLSDEELARRWAQDPASLGSISVGVAEAGRLINGVTFPTDGPWNVTSPAQAFGTVEVVASVGAAIRAVDAEFPGGTRINVNHISSRDGGWLRPHKSHQTGRDVDLGFYYLEEGAHVHADRAKYFDVARNWALIRALVIHGDVQLILVDRKIIQRLHDHALSIGEDPAWVRSIAGPGADSILRHARRHKDHFHARYFDGRAQELGRRVQPMLARRPEHNVVAHRIKSGDTLGRIAIRYGSTQELIKRANRMKNSFLRAGRVLMIPLRGPCTVCPEAPAVVVPRRRLPPDLVVAEEANVTVSDHAIAPPAPPARAPSSLARPASAERCTRAL